MTLKRLLILGGAGALAMYFLDPKMGRTRRAKVADQIAGLTRKTVRKAEQQGRYVAGHVEGMQHAMSGDEPAGPPPNDATLTAKVESEVVTRLAHPKGSINVNAEEGVVYLRGQLEDEGQIRSLEDEVRSLDGVAGVVNLLHLPGQPAPNKEEALHASRPH